MPDPPGTSRFASADRGQMLQDYTIGISIFVVAVMLAIGSPTATFVSSIHCQLRRRRC